jgi:glycerol uptake facilitator protein
MTTFTAELMGTFMLILLGNGVVANAILNETKGNNGGWLMINMGWAFAVFTGVIVAQDVSGAHLNPAVSIGLALAGKFPWADVPFYILAQMIGAMLGALAVWLAYKDHYTVTKDPSAILGTFCTAPAIRKNVSNVITEAIGTLVLLGAVLYMSAPNFATAEPGLAPGLGSIGALPVALIVLVIGLSLGGPTGYAINPARDLGPRIVHAILPLKNKGTNDWGYSWIPVLGPVLGALVAAQLFLILG